MTSTMVRSWGGTFPFWVHLHRFRKVGPRTSYASWLTGLEIFHQDVISRVRFPGLGFRLSSESLPFVRRTSSLSMPGTYAHA